jgi:hypothetical protein
MLSLWRSHSSSVILFFVDLLPFSGRVLLGEEPVGVGIPTKTYVSLALCVAKIMDVTCGCKRDSLWWEKVQENLGSDIRQRIAAFSSLSLSI